MGTPQRAHQTTAITILTETLGYNLRRSKRTPVPPPHLLTLRREPLD
jgi:hypothetical protein